MSSGFDVKLLYSPSVNAVLNEDANIVSVIGKKGVTYYDNETTNASQKDFDFNVVMNGELFLSHNLYLQNKVTLTFNRKLKTGCDAFNSFPLLSCISNLSCTVNGAAHSVEIGNIIDVLARYSKIDDYEFTSTMLDNTQMYSEEDYDLPINPLSMYTASTKGSKGRGCYISDIVCTEDDNGNFTTVVNATITTPILGLSPFNYSKDEKLGLLNVKSFKIKGMMSNSEQHIWKTTDKTENAMPKVVWDKMKLFYHTYEINDNTFVRQSTYFYPHYDYQILRQDNSSEKGKLNTNSINAVPSAMYLCARDTTDIRDSDDACKYPNRYLPVRSINIRYGSDSLLNTTHADALYETSLRNGCNIEYLDFICANQYRSINADGNGERGVIGTGSVIKLNASDFIPNLVGGMVKNQALTIDYLISENLKKFKDVNGVDIEKYELFCLLVYNGVWTIPYNGKTSPSIGVIDNINFNEAIPLAQENLSLYSVNDLLTGGASFGSFMKSLSKGVKTGLKSLPKYANLVKTLVPSTASSVDGITDTINQLSSAFNGGYAITGGSSQIDVNSL